MKTPDMALQAVAAGQWMIKNSPMCLFKWYPGFKPEGGNHVKYPVWVEFPDLPFQYYPILKKLAEPLGKVLGIRPINEINPRWHPQVLVEIDLSQDLPTAWTLVRDDGITMEQEIFYKHLPNACFHCGTKGHIVKDCPKKNKAQLAKPSSSETEQSNKVPPPQKNQSPQNQNPQNNQGKGQPIPIPKKGPAPQVKKAPFHTNNQFSLLEKLDDLSDFEQNLALTVVQKQPQVNLERLEQEVEALDSQVSATPEPPPKDKGKKDGPTDMETQKDNKRTQQSAQHTPDKNSKDKGKKKRF